MFQYTTLYEKVIEFSRLLPLEWFTFLGSIIEEIIGIIPSPLVLTVAGSLALADERSLPYIFFLGLLASTGKTLASWVIYVVADKAEDIVIGKFGNLIGVTHEKVEALGKKFGNGRKDDILIFLSRAIPFFPSVAVTVACGAIKVAVLPFLIATFLGNYVRSMFYLYIGYSGIEFAQYLSKLLM